MRGSNAISDNGQMRWRFVMRGSNAISDNGQMRWKLLCVDPTQFLIMVKCGGGFLRSVPPQSRNMTKCGGSFYAWFQRNLDIWSNAMEFLMHGSNAIREYDQMRWRFVMRESNAISDYGQMRWIIVRIVPPQYSIVKTCVGTI